MPQYDLVIRGGTVVDGSGGEPFKADVAVSGGVIAALGEVAAAGVEEIDARGRIVTPGFIDIHTHYDGQATWDERMTPSSNHGATTVITGNCGVGFAPCRPGQRDMLVKLMEGVEDIPEVVLTDGLAWNWQTFPEYLDILEARRFDVDVGTQVPHSPIRVYVMGQRGADREPATEAEISEMRRLVAEAVNAGAFGVSTQRFVNHRTRAGEIAPSVDARDAELEGLAAGLRDAGGGVFQIIPAMPGEPEVEYALMKRLVAASGQPLSFSLIPRTWETYMRLLREDQPAEASIRAQVFPRPMGLLFGLELSCHPFSLNPSYRAVVDLPLAQKVEALREPDLRARLLAEAPADPNSALVDLLNRPREVFRLGDPPNYAPTPDEGATAQAARLGVSPRELIYDWLLEDGGHSLLFQPGSNYIGGKIDATAEMMKSSSTLLALGDGGAHYGMICDASYPTTLLSEWVRDGRHGGLSLAWTVNQLTGAPSEAVGLLDRGRIAVGAKADLNVIDLPRLHLHAPRVTRDLPGGGRRLRQRADGYDATIVSGLVTYRDGEPTGALPGRLLRRGRTPLRA